MEKTRYEGLYSKVDAKGIKSYIARFKIDNKPYKKVVGKEPAVNMKTANRLRLEMIEDIKMNGNSTKKQNMKLDDFFPDYIEYRKPNISDSWYTSQKSTYRKYIQPTMGQKKLSSITSIDIQKAINNMLESGLKHQTAKLMKDMMRALYNNLDKFGIELKNVATDVEIPKFDNKREINLTDEEIKKLFNIIINYPDITFRTLFVWLIHGRRKNEVVTIKWENIDIPNMIYTVTAVNNKISKSITYSISSILYDALVEYGIKKEGLVFHQRNDETKTFSKYGIDYHWNKVRALSGLAYINMHDLRHILGGFGVNKGYSLEVIGSALGHSSTQVTARYSNVKRKSADTLVDDMLESMQLHR